MNRAGGREKIRAALAGSLGANQGYFASSLDADKKWVSVKAAYILAGSQFRRIVVQTPLSSEPDRENVVVTFRPIPSISLSAGRQNFLEPSSQGRPSFRGTVDQYAASA